MTGRGSRRSVDPPYLTPPARLLWTPYETPRGIKQGGPDFSQESSQVRKPTKIAPSAAPRVVAPRFGCFGRRGLCRSFGPGSRRLTGPRPCLPNDEELHHESGPAFTRS
jgi:hypothetical protein